jgi:hypothetical protein
MPKPEQDLPPGVPIYATGALPQSNPVLTPAPTLLQRVMTMFHPTPSPVPQLINRSTQLERQLDVLQARSTGQ